MKESQPPDRDVDRVRRALREAAPRDEAAGGRAADVVRRGRRSRARGIASAAAVGLAAAAIVIGPHLIDGSPVTNDASGSSTVSPTDAQASGGSDASPHAHPCPAAPVQVPDPPATRVDLHPDVAMVRLCRAAGGGVASAWQAPADGLVMGVDDFIARVNRLPKSSPDPCPTARVTPQPFALLFTDAEGHTQTLSSMFSYCGTVTVNSRRVAADRVLDIYRHLLARQRDALAPHPPSTTPP